MGGCEARVATRVTPSYEVRRLSVQIKEHNQTARSPEYFELPSELRAIINYVRIFESFHQCQAEIKKILCGKIFLLTNIPHGLPCLNLIHDHPTLHSVYIYDSNNTIGVPRDQFNKIRGVYDSIENAKRYLWDDVKSLLEKGNAANFDSDDEELSDEFVMFVDSVRSRPSEILSGDEIRRLICVCQNYFSGNPTDEKFIEAFRQNYRAEEVFIWLKNDSCFRRVLDRALIEENWQILLELFPLIVDFDVSIRDPRFVEEIRQEIFVASPLDEKQIEKFRSADGKVFTAKNFLLGKNFLAQDEPISVRIVPKGKVRVFDRRENRFNVIFPLGTKFSVSKFSEEKFEIRQIEENLSREKLQRKSTALVVRANFAFLKDGANGAIEFYRKILPEIDSNDAKTLAAIYEHLAFFYQKIDDQQNANFMFDKSLFYSEQQILELNFYFDRAGKFYAFQRDDWQQAKNIWMKKLQLEQIQQNENDQRQTLTNLVQATIKTKDFRSAVQFANRAIELTGNDEQTRRFFEEQKHFAQQKLSQADGNNA